MQGRAEPLTLARVHHFLSIRSTLSVDTCDRAIESRLAQYQKRGQNLNPSVNKNSYVTEVVSY
jgi:hypothetical protein